MRPISGNPRVTVAILESKIMFVATTLSLTTVIFSTLIYVLYHFWSSFFQRSRTRPFEEVSPLKLQKFTCKELKSATNSFSPENAIGKGGSGSVFRGILKDEKSVAVKLLDPCHSLQADKEFQNELTILGTINSPLIVSLLGHCVYKNKRIFVYEYMPNRSLQELLFSDGISVVGWDRRFQIIRDVCRALEFLHNECDPPFYWILGLLILEEVVAVRHRVSNPVSSVLLLFVSLIWWKIQASLLLQACFLKLRTVVGAAEGAIDAANILKPALARVELQFVYWSHHT